MRPAVISSIRPGFPGLSQSQGQVTHVLLTRSPLIPGASTGSSFDLHVLSTPPAFILSQDQTLRKCITDTTQAPGKTGRPCCTKFETSQKNQPTTPKRGRPAHSTNQKTIGINKLGTLLSSQTTGTTGTRNPAKPGLHRSEATSQAYPHQPIPANPLPRTTTGQTGNQHRQTNPQQQTPNQDHPRNQCTAHAGNSLRNVWVLPPSPGRLNNYTTPTTPTQIHPNTRQTPAEHPTNAALRPPPAARRRHESTAGLLSPSRSPRQRAAGAVCMSDGGSRISRVP